MQASTILYSSYFDEMIKKLGNEWAITEGNIAHGDNMLSIFCKHKNFMENQEISCKRVSCFLEVVRKFTSCCVRYYYMRPFKKQVVIFFVMPRSHSFKRI